MPPGRPSNLAKSAIKGASNFKKLTSTDSELPAVLAGYLESQRKTKVGINESNTDVILVCNDGVIPCHGVILQAVSPFFEKIFEAHGPHTIGHRDVIMPDFSVDIMRYVIRLIYNQNVYMRYDFEIEEVEEVITYLQIYPNHKLSSMRCKKPAGDEQEDIACYPKSSKPFLAGPTIRFGEFGKVDVKLKSKSNNAVAVENETEMDEGGSTSSVNNMDKESEDSNNYEVQDQNPDHGVEQATSVELTPISFATRSRRTPRATSQSQNQNQNQIQPQTASTSENVSDAEDDKDEAEPSSESSEEEESDDSSYSKGGRKRRRGRKGKKQTKTVNSKSNKPLSSTGTETDSTGTANNNIFKVRQVKVALKKLSPSKATATRTTASTTPSTVRNLKKGGSTAKNDKEKSGRKTDKEIDGDSSTDSEIDESFYKNHEWFATQSKKCQTCKKTFDNAAKATQCLNSHSRLRCYFCFRVCKNTEQLFQHFQRAHKKAGRENFLMCPFCEQSIPFKSVSCHVISTHLSNTKNADGKSQSKNQSNGSGNDKEGGFTVPKSSARAPRKSVGPASKKVRLSDDPPKTNTNATDSAVDTVHGGNENELRVGDLHCTIKRVKKNGETLVYSLTKSRGAS